MTKRFRIVQSGYGYIYVEYRWWFIWRRVCSLNGWMMFESVDDAADFICDQGKPRGTSKVLYDTGSSRAH